VSAEAAALPVDPERDGPVSGSVEVSESIEIVVEAEASDEDDDDELEGDEAPHRVHGLVARGAADDQH
jgi:hypothetical protein